MSITWSEKQKAAIKALGQNTLVSASAGAGKTTVLIGRLMKRMEIDRVPITDIIAVTFTELAAMEMRKRLAKSLNERFEETNDLFLKEQISLLPNAIISTIHSFCLRLIKDYGYVIDLDPSIASNVLDESETKMMMETAFKSVYVRMIADPSIDLSTLVEHFDQRPESIDTFKENVFRLADKLKTLDDPSQWNMHSLDALKVKSFITLPPILQQYLQLYFKWKCDNLIQLILYTKIKLSEEKEYLAVLTDKQQQKMESIHANYDQMVSLLKPLSSRIMKMSYKEIRNQITSLSMIGFLGTPLAKEYPKIKNLVDHVTSAYNRILAVLYDEDEWFSDAELLLPRMNLLADFTLTFMAEFQEIKLKQKVMDFDDMEYYALKILKEERYHIGAVLRLKFQEIVIDEFQDTNEVQNRIIELLGQGNNIFRVGDIKQSIYRFRNAKPQMMQQMMQQESGMSVLHLDENYRSKASIVDFNNLLFNRLMNFAELQSSYSPEDFVKIGRADQKGGSVVEMHLLEKPDEYGHEEAETEYEDGSEEESIDEEEETVEDKNAHPKAVHIVNEIQRMRKETEFHDYRDYVVLVRTNQQKAILKRMFEKANIPAHVSAKTGFYLSNAVQDVLLMLNVLQDSDDNLSFIGLCLSRFTGLSEDETANMKLSKDKFESYFDIFERTYPNKAKDLLDLQLVVKKANWIELMRNIYQFNDFYEKCSIQDQTNLDLLFERVAHFQDLDRSLNEILYILHAMKEDKSSEAIPFTDEDNVVRVMTIHQAKGLEFKNVFYWSQGTSRIRDNMSPLLMDTQLGFIINTVRLPERYTRKNPIRLCMEMKSVLDDVQEQIRLLYVTLTRAEYRLIIVDQVADRDYPLHYTSILNSIGPTNWILSAMKNDPTLQVSLFPHTLEFSRKPEPQAESKILAIVEKETETIQVRTPSMSHKANSKYRLNFAHDIGSQYGTSIHKLFEKLSNLDHIEEKTIRALFPEIKDEDISRVEFFYRSEVYKEMKKGELKHELPFFGFVENELIHGYMDMVGITEEKVYLIDFKTDKLDREEDFLERYKSQLIDYKSILEYQFREKKVLPIIYSLNMKRFIFV